jgi:hypothetical protein
MSGTPCPCLVCLACPEHTGQAATDRRHLRCPSCGGPLRVVIGLNASGYTAEARRAGAALTTREEAQHACDGVFSQAPSDGSFLHLLETTMPISAVGEIAYQVAPPMGGIRLQANPPVCNHCWREITQQNFGCATVVGEEPHPGRFEFIECTACAPVRGPRRGVTLFWAQHER